MSRSNLVRALLALAPLICSSAAAGAEPLFTPDCTTDNLLQRRLPAMRQDLRGNPLLVTDESLAPEGAQWDSPVAMVLETPAGSVTYDLGQPTTVSSFFVQADANDTYKVLGSLDGAQGSFRLLTEIDTVEGNGLRSRTATVNPTTVRYLRIGEGQGDDFYSISEFAAYCRAPTPFPPVFRKVDAPPARVVAPSFWDLAWWNNDTSARVEMFLAIGGVALISWGIWLRRRGTPEVDRKLRNGLMMTLGFLSLLAYWNFGAFHFYNRIHIWDTYHYYIGSKYFPELSYDRLYECAAVADSETPSLRRRVELRKIMNLHTNMIGGTTEALAHPEHCKQHFTPERWEAFKHDIEYFRIQHGVKRWEEAQTDHGYNATPVWNILGTTLANTGPASPTQIALLILFDPALAFGMMAMIWWAFGWRVLCVALAVFASNFPSRFYWTGGSFLRWDYLFYLVGGICLVKKEKYLWGGFFLSYTAMLRIFPIFVFVGPLMVLIQELRRTGKVDGRYRSMTIGALLAVALLIPISLVKSGGLEGYRRFAQNTAKHASTPLTNYMGLRTVVAYKVSEAGRVLRSEKAEDPWGAWKLAKLRTFHRPFRQFIFFALVAGFLALLWFAVRGVEPWVACSLSVTLMAVGPELTCYYYAFLIAAALLYGARREAGLALLVVTAATGFIDWAPTRFLPNTAPWIFMKMPTWLDEQYMWMAVVTLIGFGWILYRFAFVPDSAIPIAGLVAEGGAGTAALTGESAAGSSPATAKGGAAGPRSERRDPSSSRYRRGGARKRRDRRKK
jgi:hypothetical protein